MNIKNTLDLILQIDQLSLEDYARKVSNIIPSIEDNKKEISDLINNNPYEQRSGLLNKIKSLSDNGILPNMSKNPAFGLERLNVDNFYHEDYLGFHLEESHMALPVLNDTGPDFEEVNASSDSIYILMPLIESEILIGSSELPGYSFLLYHDEAYPYFFSNSDENLIKCMITVQLLTDPNLFIELLKHIPKKKGEKLEPTAISTLKHLLETNFEILHHVNFEGFYKDQFHDTYDEWCE